MKQENISHDLTGQPFYLLVIGLFLLVVSPVLFSEGMFMDGLIYADISRNLAQGIGTFWNLFFSETCMREFHEHPPLAFGMQAALFKIFGDALWIDKVYSVLTFLFTGFLMLLIWRQFKPNQGWLVLLFWLSTPTVMWAVSNNILENTLTIFLTCSVLFCLLSSNSHRFWFLFISGFCLALGLLTKGFVALFPLSFPFCLYLSRVRKSFVYMFTDSLLLILFTVLPLIVLFIAYPESWESIRKYLDVQVINSLKNIKTVNSRFYIIERLFLDMIPLMILIAIIMVLFFRKKVDFQIDRSYFRYGYSLIFLGLTGVLPIMVSMKQSGFYIFPAFPFFALGFALLMYPYVSVLLDRLRHHAKAIRLLRPVSFVVFLSGVFLTVYFSGSIGRDQNKIHDVRQVLTLMPEGGVLNVHPDLWSDWSLQAYFVRYKHVSADPHFSNPHEYLLMPANTNNDSLRNNFDVVNLALRDYVLFRRKRF